MNKTTDELMEALQGKNSVEHYLRDNREEFIRDTLSGYLEKLLQSHQCTKAEVVAASQLERSYCYHLFSGRKATPSRDVLLSLALAMQLTLDEVQTLLRIAHQAMLYPRIRRDSLIISAVTSGKSVIACNELLERFGEPILGA